jgi:hypothetical protein
MKGEHVNVIAIFHFMVSPTTQAVDLTGMRHPEVKPRKKPLRQSFEKFILLSQAQRCLMPLLIMQFLIFGDYALKVDGASKEGKINEKMGYC